MGRIDRFLLWLEGQAEGALNDGTLADGRWASRWQRLRFRFADRLGARIERRRWERGEW